VNRTTTPCKQVDETVRRQLAGVPHVHRSGQWDRDPLPISPGCQHPTTLNGAGAVCLRSTDCARRDLAGDYYLNPDQRIAWSRMASGAFRTDFS